MQAVFKTCRTRIDHDPRACSDDGILQIPDLFSGVTAGRQNPRCVRIPLEGSARLPVQENVTRPLT
jgi:hypothetical protein